METLAIAQCIPIKSKANLSSEDYLTNLSQTLSMANAW